MTSTDGHESVAKPPTYYKTCCTQQTDQSRCPRSVLVELDNPLPCVIVGALVFRSEAVTCRRGVSKTLEERDRRGRTDRCNHMHNHVGQQFRLTIGRLVAVVCVFSSVSGARLIDSRCDAGSW